MTHWTHSPRPRPTARRHWASVLAGLALAALALTACGGGSTGSATAGTSSAGSGASTDTAAGAASKTIGAGGTITATEAEFSISLGGDTVAAGPYVVHVENRGSATHDLVVEKDGAQIAGTSSISPGSSASLSVTLKPGDYDFYCSIGNHRAMGMETTVHVK